MTVPGSSVSCCCALGRFMANQNFGLKEKTLRENSKSWEFRKYSREDSFCSAGLAGKC